MMKNKLSIFCFIAVLVVSAFTVNAQRKFETVPGDPLNVRIYTLDNGLKVYMSVNKSKPRIQTFIGVRVGGKNDPAETTGLAHYFEHLMFKGTERFGTSDYAAEKPYLDKIESLFEIYRKTTDDAERKEIYAEIDSLSQEASKIAIPNEYDKLMAAIGASGTNAFTSYDVTAYTENIPSNEIENWAKIQSDRFGNPVLRLFHTELETVYEEYNMSLTRDARKVNEAFMNALFPHHPYGTQTVLGKGEHLKNPSLTNIKKYFDTYYVPNNMAVIMAGDFDPDSAIEIIEKYFGNMKSKPIPALETGAEQPITSPIVREVVGLETDQVAIAFRLPGAACKEAATGELTGSLLTNGKAGLIDLNLIQKQKVLRAGGYANFLSDYGCMILYGSPKEDQTLEQVRDLLLEQVEMLKKGEFDDGLLQAVINNFKLDKYREQQEINYTAYAMLFSFVNGTEWKDEVDMIDFQAGLTKKDITDFCNKYFNDNYVVVYKRQGKPDDAKIEKPTITPVAANRDSRSAFLDEIKNSKVMPIEPVFLDYSKDLTKLTAKNNIPVLYKHNDENPLFSLYYVFETGNNNDKALGTAFSYLNYLGTSTKSAEEIKRELYNLACSFDVRATDQQIFVSVNGLSDNFEKAMKLLEDRLDDVKADSEAYNNLAADILKARSNEKLNQTAIFQRLESYAQWGPESAMTNILSEQELKSMNPDELIKRIKDLKGFEHKILYYGPLQENDLIGLLNENHNIPDELKPVPAPVNFVEQETNDNKVLLAHYDAKQIYMSMISKGGKFDKNLEPLRTAYNNYFGSGMNSIVFQEMREARGLAYTARANYMRPVKPNRSYFMGTFIATQNDKMKDAVDAFLSILNDMPESEKALEIAKDNIITRIRTDRILREAVLVNYINDSEFGYDTDPRKELFEKLPDMTMKDIKSFQELYVKDKPYTYCILGDTNDLDENALSSFGTITKLTLEEIFGY